MGSIFLVRIFIKSTSLMFDLKIASPQIWLQKVLDNFDEFLIDHASCEKKAAGMAISLASHYYQHMDLVEAMTDLALEEMNHFRQCVRLLKERNIALKPDVKDHYITELRKHVRNGKREFLLDRLVLFAIVEKRGHERFGLIAEGLKEGKLKEFYRVITRSEANHFELFINLAKQHFDESEVIERTDQLLTVEAEVIANLVITPRLH